MHRLSLPTSFRRSRAAAAAALCVAALTTPLVASPAAAAAPGALPVSDGYRPRADIGFHDWTRDGTAREIRDDLAGDLGAMVEFAQASTVDPVGNRTQNKPTTVADRDTLLLVTPTAPADSLTVEVRVKGEVKGTLALAHPNRLPASDQNYDSRGTVAYSLRAWSAKIPHEWMKPGLSLRVTDGKGRSGTLEKVDVAAPKEMVINNIRLGMLTDAPVSNNHRFITDPANGATDYFQTLPIAKLTMAQYETVELDNVIVGSGAIYTVDNPDPSKGDVYSGTMRENVGKAQVSTGINLATWGITSAPMTQQQPQSTNQRVIHHSRGKYANGVTSHGLSGGNGMATLYDSVGNELSHELGHSYGLGHYPGMDNKKTGDDIIRDASHNMDSGWGYIPYRGLMRSNLDVGAFKPDRKVNDVLFRENLAGKYNFNTDAMSGGWDASPVSDYTHHTAFSLTRIQDSLRTLVADTEYPSGYRDWDATAGEWVDAKKLNPKFGLLAPKQVGVPVFTLLGGYNPAKPEQTLLYPAFRSNYGVTFDLPQPDTASGKRACWVEVDFADGASKRIALDAGDGVKQLNVNIAEADRPTGAQIACQTDGVIAKMGDRITIATDLPKMPDPVVVGEEAGFETLRKQELKALQPKLEAQAAATAPVLSAADMIVLKGWSDDLSLLSPTAREVADRILKLVADAADVEAYLAEHGRAGVTAAEYPELAGFLKDNGYVDDEGGIVPTGTPVTVDNGACLYQGETSLRVDNAKDCATKHDEEWFVDVSGRIHSAQQPGLCVGAGTPARLQPCSVSDVSQRWMLQPDGHVVQQSNTKSALDFHRQNGYPGMYNHSGGANQIWKGFTANTNPLLGYLSTKGLAAFVGDITAVDPGPGLENRPGAGEGENAGPGDVVVPEEQPQPEDRPGANVPEAGAPEANRPGGGSGAGEALGPDVSGDLATTGSGLPWAVLGSGLVLALAGASVLLFRRARNA